MENVYNVSIDDLIFMIRAKNYLVLFKELDSCGYIKGKLLLVDIDMDHYYTKYTLAFMYYMIQSPALIRTITYNSFEYNLFGYNEFNDKVHDLLVPLDKLELVKDLSTKELQQLFDVDLKIIKRQLKKVR